MNIDIKKLVISIAICQLAGIIGGLFTSPAIPDWKRYYRRYSVLFAHLIRDGGKHYFHVLTDKCMLIDIDTPQDLQWAETVIREGLFDFGF